MPLREVTAISVLQDPALAASLSVEEWATLQQTADWAHLVEEYSDVIATQLGASVPALAQIAPPAPNLGAQQTQFKYLGTRPPRVQGLGVVSNVGWYTQNLNRGS